MQGISEYAAKRANDNDADTIQHEEDVDQKILTCIAKCKVPGLIEPSISMVKTKVPSKHPINPQGLHTPVPYEQFIKLIPCAKMLICEAQKAEHGYEPDNELCKLNFHEVDNVTTDDLAPDIDDLDISGYQDKANIDDSDAGKQGVEDDEQLLAHVTQCNVLRPNDI